jgi:hypothetical protein
MFQFSGLAPFRVIHLQCTRLSHSEIFGLSLVCSYPKLIAAYHVLHRLLVPRHPPCALIRFKYCIPYLALQPRIHCFSLLLVTSLPGGRRNKNCFPNMSKNFKQHNNRKLIMCKLSIDFVNVRGVEPHPQPILLHPFSPFSKNFFFLFSPPLFLFSIAFPETECKGNPYSQTSKLFFTFFQNCFLNNPSFYFQSLSIF